ncbi:MAG: flagellar M-ring protein FliF [Frankiales bacterium]|nr:flagellar M-ring protein FliF [Frankiales bacterium]
MAALDVDAVKAKASAFFKGFSPSQLVIIGLLTVVAAVGGVTFLKWVTAPTYGVLLAGMDPQDASAVVAKLDADGIAYKLASGGATVMVPTSSLDAERLAVASAGLPAGKTDSGWAAFDKQGLTSSSFQQQVAYQRAMESTLSSAVGAIDGVRSAEVHLALPEKRLFTDDQKPARASVLVSTDGSLGDDAIDAMTHLVASSVPDLQAADVSVTDSSGHLLTSEGSSTGTDKAARARTTMEGTLEARATTMFDALLGPGHAVVRVNAEIDTANRTIDSEVYDPTKQAVLSSSASEEKYGTPSGATGPTGVLSGTPAVVPSASASPSTGYSKTSKDQQMGVSRTVEHAAVAPGGVKRLTVAVAVDRNAKNAPGAAELQAMVANAVGLDLKRGDTISVTTPSFLGTAESAKAGTTTASGSSKLTELAPQVLGGVLLLLVSLGLLRTVRRGVATELSPAEVTAALDRSGAAKALPAAAQGALPAGSVPAPRSEEDDLLSRLDDPDEVAGMLRGWLATSGSDR